MYIVRAGKVEEVSINDIVEYSQKFRRKVLDLGTGDGRFIYKSALSDQSTLFVGLEPAYKQMYEYEKQSRKKKLTNTIYGVGSAEEIPFTNSKLKFDEIFITLPWGSLLEQVIKPTKFFIQSIKSILTEQGTLSITLGYDAEFEPSETKRLSLPSIDQLYISNLGQTYTKFGFLVRSTTQISKEDLSKMESSWGKKLSYGNNRPIFKLILCPVNA